ncbi:uncharacterized protein LOC133302880 isoform X2 [Gastrolobium bilobum]|uniref:uncharacterized protein LOC133302880 isoform X2 n=1 Tax=Gastrolobium bilobum TaxID=150636 RepID=UPI002AB202AD|nr:uncharacterized protein LOC133302880 isoform X2 [Gastrolobium bilobum]
MEEEFAKMEVEDQFEDNEINLNYEFDAPRFCDFTRPETFFDAAEAEQWFEFTASYPPSPFLVRLRLRWGNADEMKSENMVADDSGPCMEPEQDSSIEDNNNTGLEHCDQTRQDTLNGEKEPLRKSSPSKSKVLSFMKPTASHLAKQKNTPEAQTHQLFTRFQRQNSSSTDRQLTKRQKLETGYSRKIARLKHQILFTHKKHKGVDLTDANLASKPKVTIPKEPNLETALRAQRRKSRTNAESGGHTKLSSEALRSRSLNKKAGGILNCNSISNSETKDLKRTNSTSSVGSRQEKYRMVNKLQGNPDDKQFSGKGERGVFRSIKVFPMEPYDKRVLNEPPTELFSKLSMASEVKQTKKSLSKEQPISKGLKENIPGSLRKEHEMMNLVQEEIQRRCRKQYQCVSKMSPSYQRGPACWNLDVS